MNKQEAINAEQERHFRDPDVGRRVQQAAMARYPDIQAIADKAEAEGKRIVAQRLAKAVAPIYPISARMTHVTGGVWIAFVIGPDGVPQRLEWIFDEKAINVPVFAAAAMDAVRQWRFEPATLDGQPVAVITIVPVIFQFPY